MSACARCDTQKASIPADVFRNQTFLIAQGCVALVFDEATIGDQTNPPRYSPDLVPRSPGDHIGLRALFKEFRIEKHTLAGHAEAEQLWTAERKCSISDGHISATWGCVALLIRPGLELPQQFLDDWAGRVSGSPDYGRVLQTADEGTLVNGRGLLEIDWPEPIDPPYPIDLDLLLATATCPCLLGSPPRYPTPAEIADAWGQNPQQIGYFIENRANSICTFQDEEILAHLKEHFPALYNSCHTC